MPMPYWGRGPKPVGRPGPKQKRHGDGRDKEAPSGAQLRTAEDHYCFNQSTGLAASACLSGHLGPLRFS